MIESKWIDTSDDKSLDDSIKIKQTPSPFNRIKKITTSLPPNCHKFHQSVSLQS